jgi:hypothetical protein
MPKGNTCSCLEETIDLSSFGIYINIEIAWSCGQTWDSLDIGRQSVTVGCQSCFDMKYEVDLQITSTSSQSHISDRHSEACWSTLEIRIM